MSLANRNRPFRHSAPELTVTTLTPPETRRRRNSYCPRRHRLSDVSYSTSRPINTFEVVFTNVIDCFIFTSAIAITAYNYWMGYIVDQPRLYGPSSPCVSFTTLDLPSSPIASFISTTGAHETTGHGTDLRRIEQPQTQEQSVSSASDAQTVLRDAYPADLDGQVEGLSEESEDGDDEDRVNRMEETLQQLIRQGQAALTTTY